MKTLFFFLVATLSVSVFAQELITYPAPAGVMSSMHNDDFTVKVRKPGGNWQDLFEYNVKVDLDKPQDASMVYFDFGGAVEVAVRKNNGRFQSVRVRPDSYDIPVKIQGQTAFFTLDKPRKVSVEFDGDRLHNLHVFGNPIETSKPDPNDPDVIYFGPGLHQPKDIPGDEFNIPSGKTVYIAGGAVVRMKLVCDRVNNVRILGRGIVDQSLRGVEIRHCNNVEIEGISFINPKHYTIYGGESKDIRIKNIKSFSANPWSDGIDLMSCSDVVVDDVFLRNSDDCIAIYGHRWDFFGDAKNYKISNSTLWADVAHPIQIGIHGNNADKPETIENLLFKNIDVLEHDEDDPNYQGCMAISAGDYNMIKNVTFEDIRVEDFQEGQLLNLRVVFNEKYNTGPGRGIENVTFKNIRYQGVNLTPSRIGGYSSTRQVRNILFDNISINGRKVTGLKQANFDMGQNVTDIKFR